MRLSLYKSNKGLDELNEWLLPFVAPLRTWSGGFGLGGGKDAASWGRWRAPAEVAGQARQKSALEVKVSVNILDHCNILTVRLKP